MNESASGKNGTDIALVVEAMDLIHGGEVQTICIVSSDSDFTALAMRIARAGLDPVGIGKRQTPAHISQPLDSNLQTKNHSMQASNRQMQ